MWQTLYPYCGGPSTPPASLLNPSSCTRVRAGPAPLLRNNVRGSSIYGSFWWVFSQAQIFFFAEVLRIAETKLAFFMWGTFRIYPIEWFFLILGLRLTLGRNNIVSEGGYRGLSSFSPHIFGTGGDTAFGDWKEEDESCTWCHWQRQCKAGGFRKNGCDDSLLLTSCCGSLGSSLTAVSCTQVLPGPLAAPWAPSGVSGLKTFEQEL